MSIRADASNASQRDRIQESLERRLETIRVLAPSMSRALLDRLEAGRGGRFEVLVLPDDDPHRPPGTGTGPGARPQNENWEDATLAGEFLRDPGTAAVGFRGPAQIPQLGTGRGTGSYVFMNPWEDTTARHGFPTHEVLYHELVHSFAHLYGLLDNRPAPTRLIKARQLYNMSEFEAITLTNMYRSEGGWSPLRWAYANARTVRRVDVAAPAGRPNRAAEDERTLLLRWVGSWIGRDGGLLDDVSRQDLPHNPFRDYLLTPGALVPTWRPMSTHGFTGH